MTIRAEGDHPRVCGEQPVSNETGSPAWGSPPRVRGTASAASAARRIPRITPACAGNRHRSCPRRVHQEDHPRVCGEQNPPHGVDIRLPGSPPRVRGTACLIVLSCSSGRITPACAGNSMWVISYDDLAEDHPRVCGEQSFLENHKTCKIGSPPRVRGTESKSGLNVKHSRITPACAGNRLKKARHFYILFCQIKRIHLV